MKLWDKGYSTDSFVEEFTVGRDRELDLFLAEADVLGNMAHMKMLNSIGLISDADCKLLEQGLREIYAKVQSGEFVIEEGVEDVHLLAIRALNIGASVETESGVCENPQKAYSL